jgi:hypothetical protein
MEREPLLLGEASVRVVGASVVARAIRLKSCPGLAVTEVGRAGSWTVTHEASGCKVTPGGDYVAPWPEAVRYMRLLASQAIDWQIDWSNMQPGLRRDQIPALGEGWLLLAQVEERRAA